MLKDKHGNVVECIFPGCGKPVSAEHLASGHATCSIECAQKFKNKFGDTRRAIEAYLHSVVYCPPAKTHVYKRGMAAIGFGSTPDTPSPLFTPVMKQAGTRSNIIREAFGEADTVDGWATFEHLAKILAGGNISLDQDLVTFGWEGKVKTKPTAPSE